MSETPDWIEEYVDPYLKSKAHGPTGLDAWMSRDDLIALSRRVAARALLEEADHALAEARKNNVDADDPPGGCDGPEDTDERYNRLSGRGEGWGEAYDHLRILAAELDPEGKP